MRHPAGSHLSEEADIKLVRDNLGHANISTTASICILKMTPVTTPLRLCMGWMGDSLIRQLF